MFKKYYCYKKLLEEARVKSEFSRSELIDVFSLYTSKTYTWSLIQIAIYEGVLVKLDGKKYRVNLDVLEHRLNELREKIVKRYGWLKVGE